MNSTLFDQFAKQFFEAFLTELGKVQFNFEVPAQPCVVHTLFVPFSQSTTNSQALGGLSNENESESGTPVDQFSTQLLGGLLSPFGEVKSNVEIPTEPCFINIWFTPSSKPTADSEALGIFRKIATTPSLIEPFCNQPTVDDIEDCMLKLLRMQAQFQRQFNDEDEEILEGKLPKLWVLAPSVSDDLLSGFGANPSKDWLEGIYLLAPALKTAIIATDRLPQTDQTLLLRILGKGAIQQQAIYEAIALPKEDPRRSTILGLLANLKINIEASAKIDREERELMMILSEASLEWE